MHKTNVFGIAKIRYMTYYCDLVKNVLFQIIDISINVVAKRITYIGADDAELYIDNR